MASDTSPAFRCAGPSWIDTKFTRVGGRTILEYWIPAEDLAELNANILGTIEVVAEYR